MTFFVLFFVLFKQHLKHYLNMFVNWCMELTLFHLNFFKVDDRVIEKLL